MRSTRTIRIAAVVILLFGAFAASYALPDPYSPFSKIPGVSRFIRPYHLGLDLQGGTHLLYRADFSNFDQNQSRDEAMAGLRDIIENRVNALGVSEPLVQVETSGNEHRLIVELAGVRDINQAIRIIGETPQLEFREARDASTTAEILAAQQKGDRLNEDPYFIGTGLTGRYLENAALQFGATTNSPEIAVQFSAEGAKMFEDLTARNIGKQIGIYLDGLLRSAPVVQEKIEGGRAQISGQFTLAEARDLVRNLNSGALPVPITLVNQESVEASLGASSLRASLLAALAGFLLVALFMLVWYRLPGLIAVLALLVYVSIVLTIFKLIPVTLTTAGIAGFVLSIGMAVDANILIFERMKEELKKGRDLRSSIIEGFVRAWTSIRDSNVSSLITAVILYWLGTSVVRGFALTLAIGVLISMFSAITVSRTFMLAIAGSWFDRHRGLFGPSSQRNEDLPASQEGMKS